MSAEWLPEPRPAWSWEESRRRCLTAIAAVELEAMEERERFADWLSPGQRELDPAYRETLQVLGRAMSLDGPYTPPDSD